MNEINQTMNVLHSIVSAASSVKASVQANRSLPIGCTVNMQTVQTFSPVLKAVAIMNSMCTMPANGHVSGVQQS